MSVTIPKTKPASVESITELEKEFGPLPNDYLLFLKEHDGASPAENCFDIGDSNSSSVRVFIPCIEAVKTRKNIDGFPQDMLPIASDDCGNFVYLNPKDNAIYFWDHEVAATIHKLADSFTRFLAILKPFDGSQIKLKPGQVKSVWIDPDFKASL